MSHRNARLSVHGRMLIVERHRLGCKQGRQRRYRSRHSNDVRRVCADLGAKQKFIKAHCPWQNGKVERLNRTLATEWAYRQTFASNANRAAALAPGSRTTTLPAATHSEASPRSAAVTNVVAGYT